jgi:glycosyltransferase involved in cell wall biosynthesis
MRIAINAWFWDSPTTGSGQYTRRLVEHLAAVEPNLELIRIEPQGWKFQVASFRSQVPDRLQPETWHLKPITGDLKKVCFEQVAFPLACRRLEADVAHVPYWAPPLAPSVPTLVTIHDLIPLLLSEYRGGPLVRLYAALVSRTARSARLVVTDSEASRRDIIVNLRIPAERVRVVYLAADERFTPTRAPEDVNVRMRYGLPARYVLYLGGFDVRKNVATVLAACRRAAPAIGEDCPLVIAGRLPTEDTPFTPHPRRLAQEYGMDERLVHFTGFVDDADKPALYRDAVAFVFPSRYEGFGLPPLEALACGTPVVGSNASSIPEVVGNAGILRPPDDAEGMADALARLATNADFRAELSRRALAQAARFSWERTAQKTLAAYRDASA